MLAKNKQLQREIIDHLSKHKELQATIMKLE